MVLGSHPVPLVLCYQDSLSVTDSGGSYSETEEGITDGLLRSGLLVLREEREPCVLSVCFV